MAAIAKVHRFSWTESLVYRYLIIPTVKQALAKQKVDYAWQLSRPQQGRGRTDTFNPTTHQVQRLPHAGRQHHWNRGSAAGVEPAAARGHEPPLGRQ
jgi:hypothetical protein